MKRYSVLHPLVMSFFSTSLYRDVAQNWRGLDLLYLLLLLVLCWIPIMIKAQFALSRFVTEDSEKVVRQIPPITITNGIASVDAPMPYTIHDETGAPLIILDTTGQHTSLDDTEAKMLLTRDEFIAKRNNRETRSYSLAGIDEFSLDQARVRGWLNLLRTFGVMILFPLSLLFSFLYRFVQALIYAAIGILFARVLKANLSYKALVRLAIIAVTPVIILSTMFDLLDLSFPLQWILYLVITLVYIFFGVNANREPVAPSPNFYTPPPAENTYAANP